MKSTCTFLSFSSKWAEKHKLLHAQPNFYVHRTKVTYAFVHVMNPVFNHV